MLNNFDAKLSWYLLDKDLADCNYSGNCSKGQNEYSWLFDNTAQCKRYGCNIEQDGTREHRILINDIDGLNYWVIHAYEILWNDKIVNTYGIRPVITIPKSLIEN